MDSIPGKGAILEYLQWQIDGIGVPETDRDRFLLEVYGRAKKVLESIYVYGMESFGLTCEKFEEKLNEKPNIVFMTDEEFAKYGKALEIMDIL